MNTNFRAGLALTIIILALVGLSFLWLPYPPQAMDIPHRLLPPNLAHPFGTDAFGRDVFSNVLAGGRASLAVSFLAVLIGAGLGVPAGIASAIAGGWADELLSRVSDVVFAFPALLIAVLAASVAGPGAVDAVIAIGIFNIPVFARVARTAAGREWRKDYVLAAITAGKGRFFIARTHILPNIVPALGVQLAIQASFAILAESGLSYVGLGVQPPFPSWGRMLDDAGTLIATAPWLALFPGLAVMLTSFALALLGDGLRDLADPRREEVQ